MTSYLGVEAQQWWVDYLMWEQLLNGHPEIEGVVEIGTSAGGFSLYLAHQAEQRGFTFDTFDIYAPKINVPGFQQADVFKAPGAVLRLIEGRTVVLHCDGGDKPREVATFATRLTPGSLCVVHDWDYEFHASDIPPSMELVAAAWSASLGSLSRVLQVRT